MEAGRRPPAPAPPARQRLPEARSACDRSSAGHATPGRRAACVPAARRPRPRRLLPPLLCTLGLPSAPRACLACRPRRVIRRGIHIPSGPRRPPSTLVRAGDALILTPKSVRSWYTANTSGCETWEKRTAGGESASSAPAPCPLRRTALAGRREQQGGLAHCLDFAGRGRGGSGGGGSPPRARRPGKGSPASGLRCLTPPAWSREPGVHWRQGHAGGDFRYRAADPSDPAQPPDVRWGAVRGSALWGWKERGPALCRLDSLLTTGRRLLKNETGAIIASRMSFIVGLEGSGVGALAAKAPLTPCRVQARGRACRDDLRWDQFE